MNTRQHNALLYLQSQRERFDWADTHRCLAGLLIRYLDLPHQSISNTLFHVAEKLGLTSTQLDRLNTLSLHLSDVPGHELYYCPCNRDPRNFDFFYHHFNSVLTHQRFSTPDELARDLTPHREWDNAAPQIEDSNHAL